MDTDRSDLKECKLKGARNTQLSRFKLREVERKKERERASKQASKFLSPVVCERECDLGIRSVRRKTLVRD